MENESYFLNDFIPCKLGLKVFFIDNIKNLIFRSNIRSLRPIIIIRHCQLCEFNYLKTYQNHLQTQTEVDRSKTITAGGSMGQYLPLWPSG